MKILTINNKKEEGFLRTKTADFDFSKHSKKNIDKLIKKMKTAMFKAHGIGLSANQVGLNLNFFTAQVPEIKDQKIIGQKSYAIFNPEIMKFSKQTEIIEEGCLSVPRVYGEVERPENIILKGYDRYGRKKEIKAKGLLARVFQHEVDHLNGVLFIDKAKKLYKLKTNSRNL